MEGMSGTVGITGTGRVGTEANIVGRALGASLMTGDAAAGPEEDAGLRAAAGFKLVKSDGADNEETLGAELGTSEGLSLGTPAGACA